MNDIDEVDDDHCFAPTDLGITLPGRQALTLPILLSFLKSECPPSLLELLKNDSVIILECRLLFFEPNKHGLFSFKVFQCFYYEKKTYHASIFKWLEGNKT